jgi:rhodanese-related sulfurtransferase
LFDCGGEVMSYESRSSYAGDLLSPDAYRLLADDAHAMLIDVRTQAEWAYVGKPDLSGLGRSAFFLEWQSFPSMQVDEGFSGRLSAMLADHEVKRAAPLLFICRSGVRSRAAAVAMTSAGWGPCFNVSDGFEGPLDAGRHRGVVGGWKAVGLPWAQT